MTDARDEMSEAPPPDRPGRRPRVGDSGSPVGSTLSIILAVVAVVAGFLILRALTDDDSPAEDSGAITPVETGSGGSTATTEPDDSTPAEGSTAAPTTSSVPQTMSGATIVVANASGVSGSAAQMSTALTTEGYQGVGEAANSTGDPLPTSIVYFAPNDPAAQAVAASIAANFGGVQIAEIPVPPPAEGGGVSGATVLVMLGSDAAGKTLADLASGGAATATTAAGGATATTAAGGGTASSVAPPAIITTTTGG